MSPRLCEYCHTERAALVRPASGLRACKQCFITRFETEIHTVIQQYALFRRGSTVALGASGGKDSTVLIHVLHTLNQRYNYGLNLHLLSIDEGIKGYRDDSLKSVERNHTDYKLPLTILSYEQLYNGWSMDRIVAAIGRRNNCTFCGVFRRQALERGAMQIRAASIATGHNADDVAETVLMNMLRGDLNRLVRCVAIRSGGQDSVSSSTAVEAAAADASSQAQPQASSSASPIGLERVKPLKFTYEKEIVLYAHYQHLDYFTTECIYSPDAYRGHARQLIKDLERCDSRCILNIIRSAEQFSLNRAAQHSAKQLQQMKCERCAFISSNRVCKACVLLQGLAQGIALQMNGRLGRQQMRGKQQQTQQQSSNGKSAAAKSTKAITLQQEEDAIASAPADSEVSAPAPQSTKSVDTSADVAQPAQLPQAVLVAQSRSSHAW